MTVHPEELRAAMKWVERTPYNAHTSTLAAAVRGLYEALRGAHSPESDIRRAATDTLYRYRAALEGGEDGKG